jgi:hypothetical protein
VHGVLAQQVDAELFYEICQIRSNEVHCLHAEISLVFSGAQLRKIFSVFGHLVHVPLHLPRLFDLLSLDQVHDLAAVARACSA